MQYAIPLARKSDPETSREAARSVRNVTETQKLLHWLLLEHGPMTDEELAVKVERPGWGARLIHPISPSGLRTRRKELVDQRKVADSGQRRPTRAGRQSIVWKALLLLLAVVGCERESPTEPIRSLTPAHHDSGATDPLTDACGTAYLYLGQFEPCLYEGSNDPPADHATRALAASALIQPRNLSGTPSPGGKIVALSLGMSTTQNIWWGKKPQTRPPMFAWTAQHDPEVNQTTLVIRNGARDGQTSDKWNINTPFWLANYNRVSDSLAVWGLSDEQVQVVASLPIVRHPKSKVGGVSVSEATLPDPNANAFKMVADLGKIARSIRTRWPNAQLWILAGYMYGGYDLSGVVAEPYSYESSFAVKWVVAAQIEQARTGTIDPLAGDLSPAVAPTILFGPYLWADGSTPRNDTLTWLPTDFEDGRHPNYNGTVKAVALMMSYFKSSSFTEPWFCAGGSC